MTFEYQMLVLMTFFYMVAWVPSSFAKYQSYGRAWLGSNRESTPTEKLLPWGGRAERAYANLKDYFPAFVVAILLLGHLNKFDHLTAIASALYVAGRVFHFAAYCLGSVTFRFLSYVLAMSCNFFLLIKVLL